MSRRTSRGMVADEDCQRIIVDSCHHLARNIPGTQYVDMVLQGNPGYVSLP
jgi:hypothetical protein